VSTLLSRGNLRELTPKHWLNDEPGFTCSRCNESFGEDTETFPHPNPRFVTLRICEACHKGE
jgi:hypothetical protein